MNSAEPTVLHYFVIRLLLLAVRHAFGVCESRVLAVAVADRCPEFNLELLVVNGSLLSSSELI